MFWVWHSATSDGEAPVLNLGEDRVLLHCRNPYICILPGLLLPVQFPSMSQIELVNYLIYFKPFNYIQTND